MLTFVPMEKEFKLDRTQVSAMSFDEADNHVAYWADKSERERLNAACFLIYQIFGTNQYTKVDRTITDKRKRN